MSSPAISEPAPAKLNPSLRVLGRRKDGFHDIETVVLPLTLADGVRAEPADELRLTVAGERSGEVPRGGENMVLRAAEALREACGVRAGAHLLLVKRIPVTAGLGGGSADAAAALRALNDLWGCGLSPAALAKVGAEVGSDVPALLPGGPMVARGRGELVEGIRAARTWWVLAPMAFGVSVADAYRWWDQGGERSGPAPDAAVEALSRGDVAALAAAMRNDLEEGVASRHREVAEARERLRRAGALATVMCGSGPTMAGLARDGSHAEEVAASVGGMAAASIAGR